MTDSATSPAVFSQHLADQLGSVIFGNTAIIRGLSIALLAGGHVLLEGVPGVGKTLLAKSLAEVLGGEFRRVQCTADLMPADITGTHIWRASGERFELSRGPVFADVLLVDEINRTGPKTQSALLEAMEERAVSIDRERYPLSADFFVVASQNPHEFEGTYPLPESQLDRFLLRLLIGYPDAEAEIQVLKQYEDRHGGHGHQRLSPLPDKALEQAREGLSRVRIADTLYGYVQSLAAASRKEPRLALGLSVRGALALIRCSRAAAAIDDRDFVTPDDIQDMAPAVMSHRMILHPEAALDGVNCDEVVRDLLATVAVPRGLESASA